MVVDDGVMIGREFRFGENGWGGKGGGGGSAAAPAPGVFEDCDATRATHRVSVQLTIASAMLGKAWNEETGSRERERSSCMAT